MNFPIFRSSLRVLLPAALLLASCSKKDEPTPPAAPDQGRVNFYHAAASANVGVKFLADVSEKANLTYGQSSGYQSVAVGARVLSVNVASTGTVVPTLTAALTVEKDKNYSYFAYANTLTTQAALVTPDDLTVVPGKAKIRLVNLGQGSANPVKLSTTVAGVADIANTEVQFGFASQFVEILPGAYNVAVTTGTPSTTITNGNVGDGSGVGTAANKTYEAGKIYTVILRGITGTTVDASLAPKVVIVQNN